MSSSSRWRAAAAVAAVAGALALALTVPVRLGLDLQGGTQIVLEARDTERVKVDGDVASRTLEVLRRRVDALGVAEPSLQRSGDRRIIVELPGVADPDQAVEVIGRTAQLEFRPVLATGAADPGAAPPAGQEFRSEDGETLRLGPPAVAGEAVGSAQATLATELGTQWEVQINFRGGGGGEWARLTGQAACAPAGDPTRRVAIVLDREVISSPQVSADVRCNDGITGGETVITGQFTEREAKELALLIRAGALPVPVEVVEQRTIGPTLGDAAVKASVTAALIGAALTMLYMIAYYRLLGAVAAVALGVYGLLAYAALLAIGATLTLPGIAGFVLAIGMAVDANVLVFERAKDEHASGRGTRTAMVAGFRRAWSAIADSNATTLLAAALLFFYASGAVRGFGITLSLGVVVSMFTALVVTRSIVELLLRSQRLAARPRLLGMEVGGRLRTWLAERGPDLLGRRRLWFAVSAVALLVAAAGIAGRGLTYGLEFSGGRLLEYETERPADVDRIRDELATRGLPRAIVQESGDGNVAVRTGRLSGEEEAGVAAAVGAVAGRSTEVRDEFVGPTIGGELRRKAVLALGLALVAQLVFLAVRFRWTYATAAVLAMFHDVTILLGVFAWLGKELDGVCLAALLTVIGYSINDTVVVFDRIREHWGARKGGSFESVANEACLQTIPRTVNTGLGALFILVALYILGGETLTDFALALLIGIVVGTWSSVFTAAPLAVALERPGSPPAAPAAPPLRPGGRPRRSAPPVATTIASRPRARPPSGRKPAGAKRKRR